MTFELLSKVLRTCRLVAKCFVLGHTLKEGRVHRVTLRARGNSHIHTSKTQKQTCIRANITVLERQLSEMTAYIITSHRSKLACPLSFLPAAGSSSLVPANTTLLTGLLLACQMGGKAPTRKALDIIFVQNKISPPRTGDTTLRAQISRVTL